MSARGEYSSLFDCRVCYVRYDCGEHKPKFLECHDTICFSCVSKTMDYEFLRVKCPFCREWTYLNSSESIDTALRTNFEKLELMAIVENVAPSNQSPEEEWCYNCQKKAIDVCQKDNHCTVAIFPHILNEAQETIDQCRLSIINWEQAAVQRKTLRMIATSIQCSINRFKHRIDTLIDGNESELIALDIKVNDAKLKISTFDPLSYNLDFEKLVNKSKRDLQVAKKISEKYSSLDGTFVSILLQTNKGNLKGSEILRGPIHWAGNKETGKHNLVQRQDDLIPVDSRQLLGYLVISDFEYDTVYEPTKTIEDSKPVTQTKPLEQKTQKVEISERPLNNTSNNQSSLRCTVDPCPPIPSLLPSSPPPSPVKQADAVDYTDIVKATECLSICAWNPNENMLAATRRNEPPCLLFGVKLTNSITLRLDRTSTENRETDKIHRLAWNSEGLQLVSGSINGWIDFWTSSGQCIFQQKQHTGKVLALKYNLNGKFLATGGYDKLIKVWNVTDKNSIRTFTFHNAPVWDIDWYSVEEFASCSLDGKMFFCDIRLIDKPMLTYTGHQGWIKRLRWDPEHFLLASCSVDSTIKIWTCHRPAFLQDYNDDNKFHNQSVNAIEWSPTGRGTNYPNANRYLASCSDDQTALVLDVDKVEAVHKLKSKTKPSKMNCLSFSPDGKFLATGNDNGVVEIWSVHNGRIVNTFANHGASVRKVEWEKNGTKIGIAFYDKDYAIAEIRK